MSLAEIHKKAKLVMIPSGFKADELLYSVLPNDGSGNFTASGDTDSTRVNKDGLIEKVTTLVPRLNYDPGNPQNPHLLLEPESTNLFDYSEDFSQWVNIRTTDALSSISSPLGSANVYKIIATTDNNTHRIDKVITLTDSNTYSLSFFAKKGEYNCIRAAIGKTSVTDTFVSFNLNTGVKTETGTIASSSMVQFSNGWFRCSFTATASTADRVVIGLGNDDTYSFAGDGSSGIFLWGAMIEEKAFSTSYIPTTGSATTRSQDTCTGGGSSSIFNDSEGTLFLEISRPINDSTTRSISISDGSSSDRVIIQYISGFILGIVASETTTVATLLFSTTSTSLNKIGLRYKKNDFAMYVNGTQAGTDTSGNAPVGLSSFDFNDGTGSQKYEGKCAQAMYFDTALTNAELTTLTT